MWKVWYYQENSFNEHELPSAHGKIPVPLSSYTGKMFGEGYSHNRKNTLVNLRVLIFSIADNLQNTTTVY